MPTPPSIPPHAAGRAASAPDLVVGSDDRARCWWVGTDPTYRDYHDREWGRPVRDERAIYEKLCLEGFQAGLSWLTILRKRPALRDAFAGFDPKVVAGFDGAEVARLLADPAIIRHRGKIEAAISNARVTLTMRAAGTPLQELVWSFAPPTATRPPRHRHDIPTTTPASEALVRALRSHGWRFLGPTSAYAAMQALGLVDDHLAGCHLRGTGPPAATLR